MFHQKLLTLIPTIKRGLTWTFVDSFCGQALLIGYNLLIRTALGSYEHGMLSCLLSSVYLVSTLLNGGLNASLAPFIKTFTAGQDRVRHVFIWIFAPQIIFVCCASVALYEGSSILATTMPYLQEHGMSIIGILILESARKTVRTFLQLMLYFRAAAVIELAGICAHIAFATISMQRNTLTLVMSLHAFNLISALQLVCLMLVGYQIYRTLPSESAVLATEDIVPRFTKTRVTTWALQGLQQLYSGNMLVPVCAMHYGIAAASSMKVMTSIAHWITLIASKVFGVTGSAILAQLKTDNLSLQRKAFGYLSNLLHQAVYSLCIFLSINGTSLAALQYSPTDTISLPLLLTILLLMMCEGFFVLYEKWYIVEEDVITYLSVACASIGSLFFIVPFLASPYTMLLAILTVRLLTLWGISVFSSYRWRIAAHYRPHMPTLLIALIISCSAYGGFVIFGQFQT